MRTESTNVTARSELAQRGSSKEVVDNVAGIFVFQASATISLWSINRTMPNEWSMLNCVVICLALVPASVLVPMKQMKWRRSPDPLPISTIYWRSLRAVLGFLLVVCLPFLVFATVGAMFVFVPLLISGWVAAGIHLLFIEMVKRRPSSDSKRPV